MKLKRINPNAVFDTAAAAALLGETKECLRQWRHRNQGPEFTQLSPGDKCQYSGESLIQFRPSMFKAHR